MVALTPRFAVLAAFISLAATPLSVGAIAIPKTEVNEARFFDPAFAQSAFRLSQSKAVKREEVQCDDGDLLCLYLLGNRILKREGHSAHWTLKKNRKGKYSVSKSSKHAHSVKTSKQRQGHVRRAEEQPETGTVDIVSPANNGDKTIGHLYMSQDQKADNAQNSPKSYTVGASPQEASVFSLVKEPSTSGAEVLGDGSKQIVTLQAPMTDESGASQSWCMTYDTEKAKTSDLSMAPCTGDKNNWFAYDENTHYLEPVEPTPAGTDGDAQKVIGRDDTSKDVKLKFVPKTQEASSAKAEAASEPSVSAQPMAATSTVTTTTTVTNTPAASPSVANVDATSSTMSSSPAAASPTSVADGDAPKGVDGAPGAAGAAAVFDVQVVEPTAASSAMGSPSPAVASPSPNAQDVAASIAGSSSAAVATPSVTPAVASPSSSSVAVAPSSVSGSSAAPSARAVSTDPYKWVFRRE